MSPHRWTDVPVDRRNVRLSYLKANIFELMFAVAGIVAGAGTLLNPKINEEQAIGLVLGQAGLLWALLYLVGGLMVVTGLTRPTVKLEVAGLMMLSLAVAANGIAIVGENGLRGLTTACFYMGWAGAAFVRADLVLRIARIK